MSYYEVIFESGDHAVMQAPNDHEILSFAFNHHARAKNGLVGGPGGYPADRIVRVLVYDNDPGMTSAASALSKDVATATIKAARAEATDENGVLDVYAFMQAMMPQALTESDAHDSNYKAQELYELQPADWQGED